MPESTDINSIFAYSQFPFERRILKTQPLVRRQESLIENDVGQAARDQIIAQNSGMQVFVDHGFSNHTLRIIVLKYGLKVHQYGTRFPRDTPYGLVDP